MIETLADLMADRLGVKNERIDEINQALINFFEQKLDDDKPHLEMEEMIDFSLEKFEGNDRIIAVFSMGMIMAALHTKSQVVEKALFK